MNWNYRYKKHLCALTALLAVILMPTTALGQGGGFTAIAEVENIWSTYFGGSSTDKINAAVTDDDGNVYLVGVTSSADFPVTAGAFQSSRSGTSDAFILKLDSDGNRVFATYLGGSENDEAWDVALLSDGDIVVIGSTRSVNFPITSSAFQSSNGFGLDVFLTRFNSDGTQVWGSYMGGIFDDQGKTVSVDANDNIYIGGITASPNFPVSLGSGQSSLGGGNDAFAAKIDATNVTVEWSTYYGGTSDDQFLTSSTDSYGNVYFGGTTASSNATMVGTNNQSTYGGGTLDGLLIKYDEDGVITWSTYLGGSDNDEIHSIILSDQDSLLAVGLTASSDFPTTLDAFQSTKNNSVDAFITELKSSDSDVSFSSYHGGDGDDLGYGVGYENGRIVVAGSTKSSDLSTNGSFQSSNAGNNDFFYTVIASDRSRQYTTYLGGSGEDYLTDFLVIDRTQVLLTGYTGSSDASASIGAYQSASAGSEDGYVNKLEVPHFIDPPTLASATKDNDTQITLTFSDNVATNGTNPTDFTVTDGIGDEFTVSAQADGTTADDKIVLTVADLSSASGDLTITYTNNNNEVGSLEGAPLATDATGISIDTDQTAPTMASATKDSDTQITVTFSEKVQTNSTNPTDFTVVDDNNTDFAVSAQADGTAKDTEIVLTVANLSTATGNLKVTYTNNNNEISDFGGNLLATDATGVTIITNTAPVLDNAQSPTLTAVDEDAGDDDGSGDDGDDDVTNNTNNQGSTVSSLVVDGSITDVDGSPVEAIAVITVDNTNGSWQYTTDGSTWSDFSATTGSSVDIESAARLLDATDKIRFVPDLNYNGSATITFRAWDKSSGSSGGTSNATSNGGGSPFSSQSDEATITINAVNDTPVFTGLDNNPTYTIGTSAVPLDGDFTVFDPELDAIDNYGGSTLIIQRSGGATVEDGFDAASASTVAIETIVTKYETDQSDDDQYFEFKLRSSGDVVARIDGVKLTSQGIFEISFVDDGTPPTSTIVHELIRIWGYRYSGPNPPTTVTLDYVFNDGTADSEGTNQIVVNINLPPTISVEDEDMEYAEGDAATQIDPFATITDDNWNGAELKVQITENAESNDEISIEDPDNDGITISVDGADVEASSTTFAEASECFALVNGGTALTFTFNSSATTAMVQELLQSITYKNNSNAPSTSDRTVTFTITDIHGASVSDTRTISIIDENDNPSISDLPTSITLTEDTNGNPDFSALTIADPDAASGTLTVTLAASSGTFTYAAATGIVLTGDATGTITITGTVNDLNTYFDTPSNITYQPTTNLSGNNAATIAFTVNDNGNSGNGGGSDVDAGTVNVNITAVNDAPSIATNTGITLDEGGTEIINNTELNEGDVDDSGTGLTYTLTALPTNGSLQKNGIDLALNATFTQDDIDNELIQYVHDGSETASDSFSFSLADGGENGASALTGQTFNITINPQNDNSPVITSNGGLTTASIDVDENTIAVTTVAATDGDTGDSQTYSISGGADQALFSINSSTGVLTFQSAQDFEAPDDDDEDNVFEVEVTVTDDGSNTDVQTITVNLNDLNDNDPVVTSNQSFNVDEAASNGDIVGGRNVAATDGDANTTFSGWAITGGTGVGLFAINSSTGQLTVNGDNNFDFETTESYTLTVTVTDGTNTSTAQTITIEVNDVNDNNPVITASQCFSVSEDAANDYVVGTVVATDADANTSFSQWAITSGDAGIFTINSNSGEISVSDNTSLDYETTTGYTLTIQVTDGTNTSSTETVSITVTDVDEIAPSVTITSDAANPQKGAFTATFTFTEDVIGFELSDISSVNAVASDLNALSGSVYTALITPSSDGVVTIDVAANVALDAAGNNNTAATQLSVTNDETAPTVAITSPSPAVNQPFTTTFTFSEDVIGFASEDIEVNNATLSDFSAVSATVYTVRVTPSVIGEVTVDIGDAVATDLAGNENTSASQLNVTYELTKPELISVTLKDNTQPDDAMVYYTVEFSEAVNVSLTDFQVDQVSGFAEGIITQATLISDTEVLVGFHVSGSLYNEGNQQIKLLISDDNEIIDLAGNALGVVDNSANDIHTTNLTYENESNLTLVLEQDDVPDNSPFQITTASLGLLIPQFPQVYPDNKVKVEIELGNFNSIFEGFFTGPENQTWNIEATIRVLVEVDGAFIDAAVFSSDLQMIGHVDEDDGEVKLVLGSLNFLTLNQDYSGIGTINTFLMRFKLNLASAYLAAVLSDRLATMDYPLPPIMINEIGYHPDYPDSITYVEFYDGGIGNITLRGGNVNEANRVGVETGGIYLSIRTYTEDLLVSKSFGLSNVEYPNNFITTNENGYYVMRVTDPNVSVYKYESPQMPIEDLSIMYLNLSFGSNISMDLDYFNIEGRREEGHAYSLQRYHGNQRVRNDRIEWAYGVPTMGRENTIFLQGDTLQLYENTEQPLEIRANGGDRVDLTNGVTYAITGGADQGLFEIDEATGDLSFKTTQDFENPADADANNEYLVDITAYRDAPYNDSDTRTMVVEVLDLPNVEITSPVELTSGAFTATFTFSEDVTGFTSSDVLLGNATLSNFSATSASIYTALITPLTDGEVTIDVAANVAFDTDNNANEAAEQLKVINDEIAPDAPVVALSQSSDLGISSTDKLTSDATPEFEGTAEAGSTIEIFVDASSLGTTMADSNGNWSFGVSTDLSEGAKTITATATDAAGNTSASSDDLDITLDLSLSVSTTSPVNGESDVMPEASLVITFDKNVVKGSGDITVKQLSDNSTIGVIDVASDDVAVRGSVVTIQPSGFSLPMAAELYVNIDAGSFENEAGASFAGISNTTSWTFTTIDASVITSVDVPDDGTYKIGDNLDFELTFSLPVTITGSPTLGVTLGSQTVQAQLQGTVTAASTATFRYTVVEGDLDTDGITLGTGLSLNGAAIKDEFNVDAVTELNNVPSTTGILVDGVKPMPTISTTASAIVNSAFSVTVEFDEPVAGFGANDLTVTNGTAGNFAVVSNDKVWTFDITPSVAGDVIVQVEAGVATDVAGNDNVASNVLTRVYNRNPTDIGLSPASIQENNAIGDNVGTLSTTDEDGADTHAYTLVSGTGDVDNASFFIDGSLLKTNSVFDFETKDSYSVRVRATDPQGGVVEKAIAVAVTNQEEALIVVEGDGVFEQTILGLSTTKNWMVTNNGDAATEVRIISSAQGFSITPGSVQVNPGETKNITAVFRPTQARVYSGVVVFNFDITDEIQDNVIEVGLSGEGVIVTGVDNGQIKEEQINIFPNPASNYVTIDLSELNGMPLDIQMINPTGVSKLEKEGYDQAELTIDVTNFESGLYIIQFSNERSLVRKKVLIRK